MAKLVSVGQGSNRIWVRDETPNPPSPCTVGCSIPGVACSYPHCNCHFGYQEEGSDNCPNKR